MSASDMEIPTGIEFTDKAAAKVREIVAREGNRVLMLRVYIQGGGCSGFQYGFELEEQAGEDDVVIEKEGVKLLIDPMSFQYLMGGEVDYKEDLQGARFVVNNPNAASTCGCGMSFAL
jgi:iron-sulfur cluster insertion protein